MFQSLRSRLWVSYAFVVSVVLLIVFTALTIFAARTNLSSRFELSAAGGRYFQKGFPPLGGGGGRGTLESWAEDLHEETDMRVILFQRNGELLFDTNEDDAEILDEIDFSFREKDPQKVDSFEDSDGITWFYVSRRVEAGNNIVLALPNQPMSDVLSSPVLRELFTPLFLAGGIALILSLVFAYLISQWIVSPLQGISAAAQEMTYGKESKVEVKGPIEVKTLAKHFNHMVDSLQASQQSQRDLVANVSHELKTPLTSIQGFSQAIIDGTADSPDEIQKSAGVIFNESSRMHRLVLDLLDLAKLDAGTVEMNFDIVNLSELIEAVVEKFTPQAKNAKVTLQSVIVHLPNVYGDGDRLVQVFINLIDNAIKHTPEGGTVIVKTGSTDDRVFIRIIDSGKGIDTVQLPRIFERFYQTDKARKGGPGRGVGLGLTIANEIVMTHGGKIEVKSIMNTGSEFTVFLPIGPKS